MSAGGGTLNGRAALVTGFEPYGGWRHNPSADVATALDGETIADTPIVGRVLPVSMAGLAERVDELLSSLQPRMVLSVGLNPGSATLRVERVALNVADFARPDNAGLTLTDQPVVAAAPLALPASIAVHPIAAALRAAGIPAVVSNSAGTYLCNAVLFQFLHRVAGRALTCPCGFIHLPFAGTQVAALLDGAADGASGGVPRLDSTPSMHLETMVRGVRIAIETALTH